MKKIFKLAQIKDLLNQVYSEKITLSRFVEILNQQIKEKSNKRFIKNNKKYKYERNRKIRY